MTDRMIDVADPKVLGELLERRLGEPVAGPPVRLTGGASCETWSFTAGGRRLILRRTPPGHDREPAGMAREAAAFAAAQAAGVAVPTLVDSDTDPAVVGSPYLITEHVDGETIARRLLREDRYADARAGLAAELGATLARIHSVPLDTVPDLPTVDPLASMRETYDKLGEPLPTIEIAMKWLERNQPDAVAETVVHGDFRTGNLIIGEDGLRAVLDWEVVHRGDPREDLGWLCVKCWRFGSPLPAGGFGTVSQLLDGYAEVAGWRPSEADVLWWQVYGTARWALGCRGMAERHLSGQTPSVELIAIGRRVCEQEHDVLLALGHPAGPPVQDLPEPSDLHGHPTSAELLDAVSMFLREDVMSATDGRLNFLARVAANAVDGVRREVLAGPSMERRHRERLARFGVTDQAGLAAAIRSGRIADDDPALLATVRESVTDRLAVANPRYLSHPA